MKINVLSFLDPFVYNGGGEMITRQLINTGRLRGHDIRIISVYPGTSLQSHSDPELVMLIDVFNCPTLLRRFNRHLLQHVTKHQKFIHFDNAYVDCCNLDYLPCSGESKDQCPHKLWTKALRAIRTRDLSFACFQQDSLIQACYANSIMNIYLSPLHQATIHKMLKISNEKKTYIVKPLIDGKRFFNREIPRDIRYLFVGAIGEAKGINNLRELSYKDEIYFIGNVTKGTKLDFGTHLGFIPYDEIPVYLNRAEHFVYLPRWPEPQGRVVVEAALCGCKLITNDMVGATSFDFDLVDYDNYVSADQEFWETLERL